MPRERRLDRGPRRLPVADLAHEDHVRVHAEERLERPREPEPDLPVDLDLRDPGERVLDRVLGRQDVHIGRVDLVERGVERRRLPRARGPAAEDHAVGLTRRPPEGVEVLLREAHGVEPERDALLREEAEDAALAVARGARRDAEVYVRRLARVVLELDLPVLREPPLVDLHGRRHDLEPRDERLVRLTGKPHALGEVAVHAVADPHVPLARLDVDVARATPVGVLDEVVRELDDRRVGVRLELLDLGHVDRPLGDRHRHPVEERVLLGRAHARPELLLEDGVDLRGRRGERLVDRGLGRELEVAPPGHVERVRHDDVDRGLRGIALGRAGPR